MTHGNTVSNSNTTKRATRVSIAIGDIPMDVYQLPDGSYRLAGKNVTDAVGEPNNSLSRVYGVKSLKTLPGAMQTRINDGGDAVLVPAETAVEYWAHCASNKANKLAAMLIKSISAQPEVLGLSPSFKCVVSIPSSVEKERQRLKQKRKRQIDKASPEKQVENRLAATLPNCQQQVLTAVGQLDILTAAEVIEVKDVKAWKAALGQVLVYGGQYPSHSLRLHLFGAVRSDMVRLIENECSRFGVQVTWD